jgi:hypothetical protein
MSNPFFAFSNRAVPGTKVRADYFNARMDELVLGFDGVNTQLGLKATLASPALTGTPTAPTASPGTNTTQLATTAFVAAAIAALGGLVNSFNTRTGAVTLQSSDVTTALGFTPYNSTNPSGYITSSALTPYAPLASPALTGTPTAPTATPGTNTTQLATTAFVKAAIDALGSGVASFNTRTGAVTLTSGDVTGALGFTPVNKAGDTLTGALAVQKSDTIVWYTKVTGAGVDLKNSRWQHQTDGNIYFGGLNDAESNFTRGIHIPTSGAVAVIGGGTIWHAGNFSPSSYAPLASPNFSGTPTVVGASIWHAGNDGAGSGLDADQLDGYQAASFALLAGATFTGAVNGTTFTGSGRLFGNGSSGNNGLGKITVQSGGSPPSMSQGDICFIY